MHKFSLLEIYRNTGQSLGFGWIAGSSSFVTVEGPLGGRGGWGEESKDYVKLQTYSLLLNGEMIPFFFSFCLLLIHIYSFFQFNHYTSPQYNPMHEITFKYTLECIVLLSWIKDITLNTYWKFLIWSKQREKIYIYSINNIR